MNWLLHRFLPPLLILSLLGGWFGLLDTVADLFSGSSPTAGYVQTDQEREVIPYEQMEYVRPDLTHMRELADSACLLAEGRNTDAILEAVFEFYDAYDWFYTCYSLADIRYNADLTDAYWQSESSFCNSASNQVEQMLDELYTALADSPRRSQLERRYFGKDFFSVYDGSDYWDDEILELLEQESQLIFQYYSQSAEYTGSILSFFFRSEDKMAQTLVDLIRVRKQIAARNGYDSYEDYVNDCFYYRDYTPEEMDTYLNSVQQELVPLYRTMWEETTRELMPDPSDADEQQVFSFVREAARNMGGTVWDAFTLLEEAGLYDIAYGDNKYNSSFEVYLYSYQEPFIFMNPTLTDYDYLTFAHEFGHFCCDYASIGGSYAGTDVAEVFSQAMEYLLLCYQQDTEALTQIKMADSLQTFVEQACYTAFERAMYRIPEEALTVQALYDLYDDTARAFGFEAAGYSPDEFVTITHLYTDPMYMFSYIVSNDAAMQIYQMELAEPNSGLDCLQAHLATDEAWFLAFLEEAGLENPFAPGRIESLRDTFRQAFFG